ncbi:ATP-dependent DNA helicase RecQ [Terribacillus saccharophilus]|uniref:RecQ family ATP-dependent DNA helicase n=1 Tax=Terribacillus saccharophilus TaxID=361277 RepID=UPI0039824FCE
MSTALQQGLQRFYGYERFRTGQEEILESVMQNRHTLGVLPTGTGKSVCYQLPAFMRGGQVIVVSPLLSLMEDQVKQLRARGFKRVAALNSFLGFEEKQQILRKLQHYDLLYVSPEMLQNEFVIQRLQQLHIQLFVVDEAHCISQWGQEFRTDYLRLAEVIRTLDNPPVLALTGTATPEVQADIQHLLGDLEMDEHIYPMDRENIAYFVREVQDQQEKNETMLALLKKIQEPAIIYFSSRTMAESTAAIIRANLPELACAYYHGGMENEDRILIQQQFLAGQLQVICCTSAFGMGVDKEDVRLIIHYHLPSDKESFIQEVGRAGRDGGESVSVVLYSPGDWQIPVHLIEQDLPEKVSIQQLLRFLYQRVKAGHTELPAYELLIQHIPISETQWRFLLYQMEKHDIVKGNHLQYGAKAWKDFLDSIEKFVEGRRKHKLVQLQRMKEWVYTGTCRRQALFADFQHEVSQAKGRCCDNCGDTLTDWQASSAKTQPNRTGWREQLQHLLYQ